MKRRIRKKGYVFCLAGLIFAAGCSFAGNNGATRQDVQPAAATDPVSVSPADSVVQGETGKLDSLLQLAATAKQDTNLAKLYFTVGNIYSNYDYVKAKAYYLKLGALSEKLGWNEGSFEYAASYTDILDREGLIDSSIVINQQALVLAKKERDDTWTAMISANMGIDYTYKRWYETALNYFNEALPLLEKQSNKFRLAHVYYLIGMVYSYMDMYDDEVKYYGKSLDILNTKPDTVLRAYALTDYATALEKNLKPQFEKAESSLFEALRISKLYNNKYLLMSIYSNLGEIEMKKYDLNMMEMYARQSLEIALELEDVESCCISNRALGRVEMCNANFNQSKEYAEKALKIAVENDLPTEKKECYTLLSDLSTALHDFRNTNFYKAKADSIQTALISVRTREYAKEMEAKYETEKKELQITALEKEKRLMTGLSIAAGAVLLLTLTVLFFLWRWTVQKRRVAEQQVKHLEQKQQLVATQAVLDGETRERARLARDLHDGLGSMLTGAKLSLLDMKKGVTLDFTEVERFDRTMELIDQSVQEMRRVAHHLMPDSLSRFGLKPAVSDFCSDLPSVLFAFYGSESRLDPKLEVLIYRCIQELVNNALKHAESDTIRVQIIQEVDRIAFTVLDDGCGFNPSAVTKGSGLQNIRARIASYNGLFDIVSKAGEGTEVNVELRIEN